MRAKIYPTTLTKGLVRPLTLVPVRLLVLRFLWVQRLYPILITTETILTFSLLCLVGLPVVLRQLHHHVDHQVVLREDSFVSICWN